MSRLAAIVRNGAMLEGIDGAEAVSVDVRVGKSAEARRTLRCVSHN